MASIISDVVSASVLAARSSPSCIPSWHNPLKVSIAVKENTKADDFADRYFRR
jgi:hypothetical protein